MSFWRGRRVFLTGHTGFKGSWLSLWLAELGAKVTGFSLPPPTSPSLFEAARVGDLVTSIEGDIRDLDALSRALADAAPEVVFHLAAQALVRPSYAEPVATYATNVMGTVHLLEAVRRARGVRAAVCVTSDKVYEPRAGPLGYREGEPMGGCDPYSSSKGCAELVAAAWRRSFFPPERLAEHGVAVATARAGNVIGGGDWAADRLVPDLLAAFAAGETARIRSPNSVRPWQHVLDPLAGYLALAQRLHAGEAWAADAWNLGPPDEDARPVAEIADRLAVLWGDGAAWESTAEPGPHEAPWLELDASKARARLGWRPAWTLEEALAETVAWRRAFLEGTDMREACRERLGRTR